MMRSLVGLLMSRDYFLWDHRLWPLVFPHFLGGNVCEPTATIILIMHLAGKTPSDGRRRPIVCWLV